MPNLWRYQANERSSAPSETRSKDESRRAPNLLAPLSESLAIVPSKRSKSTKDVIRREAARRCPEGIKKADEATEAIVPKIVIALAEMPSFNRNLHNGVMKFVTGNLIERLIIVPHRRLYLMSDSIPALNSALLVAIAGHSSAEIQSHLNINQSEIADADALILEASAKQGISEEQKNIWELARNLYIPSIVLVTDFSEGEIDFDDMALIAGRILDPLITPYLVLHSDSGTPTALIELETLKIFDYSTGSRQILASEPEHKELVEEFRSEFLAKVEEFGPTGFQDALLFPAIPFIPSLGMGKVETLEYLAQLPARS